jgi:hypothetical protein
MEAIGGLHFGPKFIDGHLVEIAKGPPFKLVISNVGEAVDIS